MENVLADSNVGIQDLMSALSGGAQAGGTEFEKAAAAFAETFLSTIGIFIAITVIISLTYLVLQIAARWKYFAKAGVPGWKSIIPFYSSYTQYKFSWNTQYFWIDLGLGLLSYLCVSIGGGSVLFSILGVAAGIASMIITIVSYHHLARAFGHGAGYTAGLFFLNFIFTLMLGFSHDQYVGNPDEQDLSVL